MGKFNRKGFESFIISSLKVFGGHLKLEGRIIMIKVITYGTYDLLHYGHISLLKRAKELGDYLIVALSTDEFNWNEKQKKCYLNTIFSRVIHHGK